MRVTAFSLLLLAAPLLAQQAPPRFMYIYRDSLRRGVDSAYRAIEDDGAQICADFKCPNPYLALESLRGPHEAWWLNALASEADSARVAGAYAANRRLAEALGAVAQRKASLIGTPISGTGVYRPDLSRGPAWAVAGARFVLVTVTRDHRPANGSVWEMADSTLYILRPVRTRERVEALAREEGARIFAVRPNWSMPAPEWVASDPAFWRLAPAPRPGRQGGSATSPPRSRAVTFIAWLAILSGAYVTFMAVSRPCDLHARGRQRALAGFSSDIPIIDGQVPSGGPKAQARKPDVPGVTSDRA